MTPNNLLRVWLPKRRMDLVDSFECLAVGEDVSTSSLQDAKHWREFYRELASFEQTLSRLKRQVAGLSAGRRQDAVRQALPRLIADSETYRQRFDFWQRRLAQLRQGFDPRVASAG
jgi:hypothetical protein